ncbi:uncharacterized protein LOC142224386 [Haematobia irritans]|uniref:uncharacterized protein LOC142224386 n=1 Tax=Haematobia irritans TaxID=7368 RepID=UPI003F4FF3B8
MDKSLPKCCICQNRHALKDCPEFQRMEVHERRRHMRENRFCFKCLCSSHTRDWCRSRKTCLVCNYNHHTMLHIDDHQVRTSRSQKPNETVAPMNCRSETSTSISKRRQTSRKRRTSPKPYVHERLSPRSRVHVFLPTALARVLTPKGPAKARLLLNSAGIQTVMLKSMVQHLKLITTRKDQTEFCTLSLQSYHDASARVQITAAVKTKFDMDLPKSTSVKKLHTVYDHLTSLADPHFFNPSNVEVVIGNDQLAKILLAGLIQTSSSMPIAQSTIFGWVISGACSY